MVLDIWVTIWETQVWIYNSHYANRINSTWIKNLNVKKGEILKLLEEKCGEFLYHLKPKIIKEKLLV